MIKGLTFKGGKGSGWFGPPKGTHVLRGVSGHVWERAGQRTGFRAIRNTIKVLKRTPLLPKSKSQKWYLKMLDGNKVTGILVGNDAKVSTVLKPHMRPKPNSIEILL